MRTTKAQISLRGSVHPRSLISAFVVHCLDSIIPSISEILSLYLASMASQTGFLPDCKSRRQVFSWHGLHWIRGSFMVVKCRLNISRGLVLCVVYPFLRQLRLNLAFFYQGFFMKYLEFAAQTFSLQFWPTIMASKPFMENYAKTSVKIPCKF